MNVTLIANTPEPQRLIETCARISYESKNDPFDPEVNSKFIRKLISMGHESPLEHASATFNIDGISRTCSHQIVRHRLASFSQKSGRYTLTNGDFVRPESVVKFETDFEKSHFVVTNALQSCIDAYWEMVNNGVPKEDARFILPQAHETSLYMTANFREWRHFLKLRLDSHAQWEIRGVAEKVLGILLGIAPDVFSDIAREYIVDNCVHDSISYLDDHPDKLIELMFGVSTVDAKDLDETDKNAVSPEEPSEPSTTTTGENP